MSITLVSIQWLFVIAALKASQVFTRDTFLYSQTPKIQKSRKVMFFAKLVLLLFFTERSKIKARYILVELSDNNGGQYREAMDFLKMVPENQNVGSASVDALVNIGRLSDEDQQKTNAITRNAMSRGCSETCMQRCYHEICPKFTILYMSCLPTCFLFQGCCFGWVTNHFKAHSFLSFNRPVFAALVNTKQTKGKYRSGYIWCFDTLICIYIYIYIYIYIHTYINLLFLLHQLYQDVTLWYCLHQQWHPE